jgi:substrate import-associated zinc metallohydrolase lipoprotein
MKNIKYLVLFLLTIFIFSCKKDNKLVLQNNYLGNETAGKTAIDAYLNNQFVKPYNIDVKYKWDQSLFDQQYILVPPQETNIMPFMQGVKQAWLDPYNAETGSDVFMKEYTPKQIILSGSAEINTDGTEVLGEASGGLTILLTNVNGTDLKDEDAVTELVHVINHEFTHILNQKKVIPVEYAKVSAGDYSGNWATAQEIPLQLGFISAYARDKYTEDIAEMVSLMLTWGKDGYEAYLNKTIADPTDKTGQRLIPDPAYAAGIAKMRQKEAIVVDYFKKNFNIDFYSLQTRVHASIATISN